jgi:sugar phosphate isomerase/epimerase
MKIGLLDLIWSDWTNVDYNRVRFAAELGFHMLGAKLNVPANTITDELASHVKSVYDAQNMPMLQLWGPYPCIISPDENIRKSGVEGARDIVRLAAKMGIKESGVRATSLNPRGDYCVHPDNYKPETQDRLVRSLVEILQTAEDLDIDVVMETHVTTTLDTAENIRKIIERTGSKHLKINLDPCNYVGDLHTACNPTPMLHHIFDVLEGYISTVHLKDYYCEDRFVVHIAETVIGTGMMDFETILQRFYKGQPNGCVVIEHLPVNLIALAKTNLTAKIKELGIPLG